MEPGAQFLEAFVELITRLSRGHLILILALCGFGVAAGLRWYGKEAIWDEKKKFAIGLEYLSEKVRKGEVPVDQALLRLGKPSELEIACIPNLTGEASESCAELRLVYRYDFSRFFLPGTHSVWLQLDLAARQRGLVITNIRVEQTYG